MLIDNRSTVLQGLIDRLRAGDDSAREALLGRAGVQLERLTRRMLRDFPRVHRWEQTADILQLALLRLDKALRAEVYPATPDAFFRLATHVIRQELLGLIRHYYGPQGMGRLYKSWPELEMEQRGPDSDPGRLESWTEFHRQVEALPDELRGVFDLRYYQGLTLVEAAKVLGISEKTAQRRWDKACRTLYDALGGHLPS
jgi:RNA polymerase sigma factor (sigma-70 family)